MNVNIKKFKFSLNSFYMLVISYIMVVDVEMKMKNEMKKSQNVPIDVKQMSQSKPTNRCRHTTKDLLRNTIKLNET